MNSLLDYGYNLTLIALLTNTIVFTSPFDNWTFMGTIESVLSDSRLFAEMLNHAHILRQIDLLFSSDPSLTHPYTANCSFKSILTWSSMGDQLSLPSLRC